MGVPPFRSVLGGPFHPVLRTCAAFISIVIEVSVGSIIKQHMDVSLSSFWTLNYVTFICASTSLIWGSLTV